VPATIEIKNWGNVLLYTVRGEKKYKTKSRNDLINILTKRFESIQEEKNYFSIKGRKIIQRVTTNLK